MLLVSSLAAAQDSRIIFVSKLQTGNWQLYIANPDGSAITRITNLPATDFDLWAPVISPDGKSVVFTYGVGDSSEPNGTGTDLYRINIDGTGLRRLTHNGLSLFAHWSPDGSMLAFAVASKRSNAGIVVVMPSDGSGPIKELTTDLWDNFGPTYTPDGKQIVYYSQEGGLISAVWIMNTDGSHKRRLTDAAPKFFPAGVSPDGQHILMWNHQNSPAALDNDIFVMNLNGSNITQLTTADRPRHHNQGASYSPDGSAVLYQTDAFHAIPPGSFGVYDLVTMNADGSNRTRIVKNVGSCPDANCIDPSWGPTP